MFGSNLLYDGRVQCWIGRLVMRSGRRGHNKEDEPRTWDDEPKPLLEKDEMYMRKFE